jgi:hypothetical protein
MSAVRGVAASGRRTTAFPAMSAGMTSDAGSVKG